MFPKVASIEYLSRGNNLCRLLSQQLANPVGQLCAVAGPVVNAIALQLNRRGVRARIVGTHNLYRAAITGAVFFNNNDAVVGLLTRSNARQTNHQHWECLSKPDFWVT